MFVLPAQDDIVEMDDYGIEEAFIQGALSRVADVGVFSHS